MWWNAHTPSLQPGEARAEKPQIQGWPGLCSKISPPEKKKIILKPRKSRRMIRKYTTIAKGSVLQAKCL